MASTEKTPKSKIASRSDFTNETSEALVPAPRRVIPADYPDRAKSVTADDLYNEIEDATDPNGGNGAWESGKIGAEIGKILYKLYQSYEDWADDQGQFVKQVLHDWGNVDWVQEAGLNIYVFHDVKSGLLFTNPWFASTDDPAWLGLLDKSYYIAIFESCWFGRRGSNGWQNWGWSWYGGDWYEARGTGSHENRVIVAFDGPKSAQEILYDYADGYTSENEMYLDVIRAGSAYNNGLPTVYTINYYGSNDWNRYTIYPAAVDYGESIAKKAVEGNTEQTE
ncbi:hypothetical protein TWF718_007700 [Orbilia javanica]|uniref:Uncharacterized protein n=1 Tax=Orbilia javanica TaxID=47235 RepID=A0AAN8RBT1_9PEZI